MVVVPEPAVKGSGALGAVAVDGAIGPAGEQGADESLGLAVGRGPVGTSAQVADAKCAAGQRVSDRKVGRAVIGKQLLDLDAVPTIERTGAAQERDRSGGLLVRQNLSVGQPG